MRAPRRPDTLFWVDPARIAGTRLTLDADESRHLLRVFRAEPGTPFTATDGAGTHYRCRLADEHHGEARAEILERVTGAGELGRDLHLLVGLPETRAVEVIVEHAVPLGVASIVLAACRRSGRDELGPLKMERIERIAVASVKQSLRSRLPRLGTTPSLHAALEEVPAGARWVADAHGQAPPDLSAESPQLPVTLAVGPPGGFDDGEEALLRSAGFRPISLGPSRLTTETAAVTLLAAARNYFIGK